MVDKAVQWNLGIELVKEGAKAMRYIRVLQDRASTVVRVLEDDFEERVLYWLRDRQPANDNIEGRHPIAAGVYGSRSPSDADRDRPQHPCGATDRQRGSS